MATRLYLPSSGSAAVSPAYSGEWNGTADAVRRPLNLVKGASAMTSETLTEPSTTTVDLDYLKAQFVSEPLRGGGTLAGTVTGYVRVSQAGTAANGRAQCLVKVMSNDGATERGVALAGDLTTGSGSPASEFANATLTNRAFPRAGPITLSDVTYLDGDRIVVEYGARMHNVQSNVRTMTFRWGEAASADLAENETGTTDDNPWIEFSQTLWPSLAIHRRPRARLRR